MSLKSVGLTGHTSGIGLAIRRQLEQAGHKVLGFSRSNGFDLSKKDTLPNILSAVAECDVFINNAEFGWQQTELLYLLFERWKTQNKLIISISSNTADQMKSYPHPYAVAKGALDAASLQLSYVEDKLCRVSNIRPGWTNTPRVEGRGYGGPMLSPEEVAQMVMWLINGPEHIQIPSLTLVAASSVDNNQA